MNRILTTPLFRVPCLALSLSLSLSYWAGAADASIVEAQDLDGLVRLADRIVSGTVVDQRSEWGDRVILTDVTLRLGHCYKGSCEGDHLTVRVFGGEVDDLGMHVEGEPNFQVGEEVFVFLQEIPPLPRLAGAPPERPTRDHDGSPRFRTVGMAQGKFTVRPTGDGAVAVRRLETLKLVGRQAAKVRRLVVLELDELVSVIDGVMAR